MKLAVCFGGTYEMYYNHAKIMNNFENIFVKKDDYSFVYKNTKIKVFFAFGPKPSNVLEYVYKQVIKQGEKYPPNARAIVEGIKKYSPNYVLFFGIAGGINAELNKIYYPTNFFELYFKKPYLIHVQKIKPKNYIKINNIFGSDNIRVLTTNLPFNESLAGAVDNMELWNKIWPKIEKDLKKRNIFLKGKEAAEKWSEIMFHEKFLSILKSWGDLVDMESYIFAKNFKDKIGIMLQVSDIVGKIRLTPQREYVDWKKFNKNVIKNIYKTISMFYQS